MSDAVIEDRVMREPVLVPGARVERLVVPESPEALAETLATASRDKAGLLIAGGGTRLSLANPAREIEAVVSLCALTGVDEFEPDEGVIHARAGTPISEIQARAGSEGWELPLDPPGSTSTLGGTIASAAAGPRAQVFGSVSDAILGLELVSAEGSISKCGGRVVKNVTGYDMAKLYCGSFGSLAVVTGAWLRLRPQPAVRATFRARPERGAHDLERCRRLARLTSVRALVWSDDPGNEAPEVIIELGGSAEGVEHDRDRIAEAFELSEAPGDGIDRLRDGRVVHSEASSVVRARVLGTACSAMAQAALDAGLAIAVDPGQGVVHAQGSLASVDDLRALRSQAIAGGGFAIFEALPDAWRKDVDVFGDEEGNQALIASLKGRFDPAGILNPGRFAGGI